MVKRNKYMNVPEIRFKGLDKTWNKKTLDELVQLNSGMLLVKQYPIMD